MASKLRAGSGFPYILKEDRGEVTEPQFMLRVLSADDSDTINDLREQYIAAEDRSKKRELRLAMLRLAMFEQREDVTAILTESECWELISGAIIGAVLSTEERKKFVLPLQSETDKSASDAAANVSTE
jgi:hypothetical protein